MALSKLDQLYRQVILDHSKHPHHYGKLPYSNEEIELNNPTCGDVIKLQLQVEDGIIKDIMFEGQGCSISTASASMMCDAMIGSEVTEAKAMLTEFLALVQGQETKLNPKLAEVEVLQGVAKFPARIKCATLAWKALEQGLDENKEVTIMKNRHEKEDI